MARFVLKAGAHAWPHDLLVRYTFGNPERAAAELRAALPAFMVSCTDLATLGLWLERAITATHPSQVLEGLSQ